MQAVEEIFDITDGKNRYEPCPACGISWLMGLSGNRTHLYIVCGKCHHEGPRIEYQGMDANARRLRTMDRLAFEAWNDESRQARGAVETSEENEKGSI
jgi:ribosomal protein S27AE